jgi:alkylhydroperoxidase/carboxymuconolactone decarboxylase family protein YurZ
MEDRINLARIAASAALGDESGLKKLFRQAVSENSSLLPLTELLLQTALFAGVPRCLNAFRLFHDSLNLLPEELREKKMQELKSGYEERVTEVGQAGAATFEKVYGDKHIFLREALKKWHPVLEEWIMHSAYGQILSRPGLALPEREIAAVAALTAMNLPLQLWGHMKGALNQGVSSSELREIIQGLSSMTTHTNMALEMLEGFDE